MKTLPLLLASFLPLLSTLAATNQKPNILVILADDLGSADVGWRGGEIKTPNLDQLALSGARLDQFYVQPVCSPTRAAFLTGRYPMRHGLQVGVVRPWAQYGLPLTEKTLPQALHEAGYTTAIFGKWHLGHFQPEYLPTHRGFDHQYGHYNGALDYFDHTRDGGFDWHRDDKVNHDEGYTTHLVAPETARFITEQTPAKPFFAYVAFNAVHAPLQVPADYKKPYTNMRPNRATYAGMIAAMDEAIGKIVAALDASGARTNTLILFTTDNGGPNPGVLTRNTPFRAGKGTLYEGGVRACAFANWPGQIKSNTIVNAPLHIVDWYPTILKLAGATPKQDLPLDGHNSWPAITQSAPTPHTEILINATPNAGAIRVGDWKLVLNGHQLDSEDDSTPRPADPAKERLELYNLADDPSEKNNLAPTNPEKLRDLRTRYQTLARQQLPPKAAPKPTTYKTPKIWGEP